MCDILSATDDTVNQRCACGCGSKLDPRGDSVWFASDACQHAYYQRQATDPRDVYRRPDAAEYAGGDSWPVPLNEPSTGGDGDSRFHVDWAQAMLLSFRHARVDAAPASQWQTVTDAGTEDPAVSDPSAVTIGDREATGWVAGVDLRQSAGDDAVDVVALRVVGGLREQGLDPDGYFVWGEPPRPGTGA